MNHKIVFYSLLFLLNSALFASEIDLDLQFDEKMSIAEEKVLKQVQFIEDLQKKIDDLILQHLKAQKFDCEGEEKEKAIADMGRKWDEENLEFFLKLQHEIKSNVKKPTVIVDEFAENFKQAGNCHRSLIKFFLVKKFFDHIRLLKLVYDWEQELNKFMELTHNTAEQINE